MGANKTLWRGHSCLQRRDSSRRPSGVALSQVAPVSDRRLEFGHLASVGAAYMQPAGRRPACGHLTGMTVNLRADPQLERAATSRARVKRAAFRQVPFRVRCVETPQKRLRTEPEAGLRPAGRMYAAPTVEVQRAKLERRALARPWSFYIGQTLVGAEPLASEAVKKRGQPPRFTITDL